METRASRSSSAVSVQPLRHTTPSETHHHLPSYAGTLKRTYSRNIMNLEQRAEEMSAGGSDMGEEIRRLNEESKSPIEGRSRVNSIQSSHHGEISVLKNGGLGEGGLSRQSPQANNIVDVNGQARWGGYSPNGFVNSPVGSVRSASGWSQVSGVRGRQASTTGSSRLAQMIEPTQEGRPLDSPLGPSQGSMYSQSPPDRPSRQPSHASQSSFGRQYDQIANQIEEQLEHVPPSPPKHAEQLHERANTPPPRPRSNDTYREAQIAFKDFDGVHFSPSTEGFMELDRDGNEVRRMSARSSSGGLSMDAASMLRTPRARPIAYAEPPPADGMVYYPAPVPRMLNLPKRMSQLPAADVRQKRRTQMLSELSPEAMRSAPWISQTSLNESVSGKLRSHRSQGSGSHSDQRHPTPPQQARVMLNERMSMQNLHNLPPQLRASIFFDHQSVGQNIDIQSESAVATLDNILAASATAPVSAFTDHPFAGDVRRHTFAPEPTARRSTTTLASAYKSAAEPETVKETKKKRRSSIGNLLRRSSSGMDLEEKLEQAEQEAQVKLRKRGSRSSTLLDFNEGGNKLRKRRSQLSLSAGDELERQAEPVRTPGNETSEPDMASGLIAEAQNKPLPDDDAGERSRPPTSYSIQKLSENQQIADDFKEEEAQEDVPDEGEPMFVQPSTLLAELQVRKAQQKSRNRTAATHFPKGMHSTLLQLDAVEQVNKEKRKKQRVPLAWEDPAQSVRPEGDEDDDVPLGMLFPSKDGLIGGKKKMGDGRDWDRPLGLMEKRELEDSEPLTSRRNRLIGLPANFGKAEKQLGGAGLGGMLPNGSQLHLAGQPDAPEEDKAQAEAQAADEEEEGETLAQRLRKLRTKAALDTAISDVAPKEGERPNSTFTDDVLSQFGGLDVKEKRSSKGKESAGDGSRPATAGAAMPSAVAGAEEEETLGQRRARLQREREAGGEASAATRPNMLRQSTSLANLLAANPVGANRKTGKQHEPAHGTLLHTQQQQSAKQKASIMNTNIRSSSYGLDKPLVEANRPQTSREFGSGGLLGMQAANRAPTGGFAGGLYNDGIGGVRPTGMQTSASTPMFGMGGQNGYFASPTAGMMGYDDGMQMQQGAAMGMPMTYQPISTPRGFVYPAMPGYGYGASQVPYGASMGVPMGAAQGMGMGFEEQLDPRKREGIDRWRMSVLQ